MFQQHQGTQSNHLKRKWHKAEFLLIATPLITLLLGFGAIRMNFWTPQLKMNRPQKWGVIYQEQQRDAILDFDGVKIVFQNIIPTKPVNGSTLKSGTKFAQIPVAGGGASPPGFMMLREGQLNFTWVYNNGISSITLGSYSFKFAEHGTKLLFGSQSFNIGNPKPTVIVGKDRKAHVQPSR
jgi:hypothetical protein